MAGGALMLHQAAYGLGGSGAGALGGHEHGYLPLAAALATVLLVLACLGFARSLWRAAHGRRDVAPPPAFPILWLVATAGLLSVFTLQEWIESWATPAHAAGPAHVLAHVGWIGLGLALLLGALIASLLRGAHSATIFIAKRHASLRRPRPAASRGFPLPSPELPRLDVLAAHRASRAPPALSCS
jgi:hypothetical protein